MNWLANYGITKRRVFVSYHHAQDRSYYDEFARLFCDQYDVFTDRSVRGAIQSTNTEYVMRAIRERFIAGSSCTVVLCGYHTPWRKFVDWEIKATLDAEHGLIGIRLPTNTTNARGLWYTPQRLFENTESGYASMLSWPTLLTVDIVRNAIHTATQKPKHLIRNSTPMISRSQRRPLDAM